MFCPFCGVEVGKEAKFCNSCGEQITSAGVQKTLSGSTDRGTAGREKAVPPGGDSSSVSIPEETRLAYDMLEQSPVLRPKCIRKIRLKKSGLMINGYANSISLLPYAMRGGVPFYEKDGAVHMPSLLFLMAYVLCTLLSVILVGPIINIFLCIYSYREDKKITAYMNEALGRDSGIPSEKVRSGVIWIICNLGIFCILVSLLLR